MNDRLAVWRVLTAEERRELISRAAADTHISRPEAFRRLSRGAYEAVRKPDGRISYYDHVLLAYTFGR